MVIYTLLYPQQQLLVGRARARKATNCVPQGSDGSFNSQTRALHAHPLLQVHDCTLGVLWQSVSHGEGSHIQVYTCIHSSNHTMAARDDVGTNFETNTLRHTSRLLCVAHCFTTVYPRNNSNNSTQSIGCTYRIFCRGVKWNIYYVAGWITRFQEGKRLHTPD